MGKLPSGFRYKPGRQGLIEHNFTLDGKRRYVYGRTVSECKQKETQLRIDYEDEKKNKTEQDAYIKSEDVRMREYFEEYLQLKRPTVTENTIYNNRKVYKRIDKTFGDWKIAEIDKRQIQAFREEMIAEVVDENKNFTTAGVNRTLQLLRSIFKSAVDDEAIAKNPCSGIKNVKRAEEQARDTVHRALSDDELTVFFNGAKDSYYYNFFVLLLKTGVRCGEGLALNWDDINREESFISVTKSVTKNEEGKFIIGKDAKTEAGRRRVPLKDDVRELLHCQREITFQMFGSKTNLIFPSTKGELSTPSSIATLIYGICKKTGLKRFSTHAFRDTFATKAVEQGMAPEDLKAILGHKKLSVTMDLYFHATLEKLRDGMDKVNIAI